jgi:hypothetical protein
MDVIPPMPRDQSLLDVGVLYRTQWVGAVGALKQAVFAHLPVNKKVDWVFLISDDIGDGAKKKIIFLLILLRYYHYKIIISWHWFKAGFTSLQTKF